MIDKKSFIRVSITRQLGKNWKDNKELANEVIAYANKEVFNISEKLVENWRKVNKVFKNEDMNANQAKQNTNN